MISNFNCVNPLSPMLFKCVSMTNQECNLRLQIVNVNSDQPVFYLFSIKTSKCNDNCTNIDNPYAKICVPDVVKNLNVKVFNLMARTNETRHTQNGMKRVNVNVDQMQAFVIISNVGMMINAGVNAKN